MLSKKSHENITGYQIYYSWYILSFTNVQLTVSWFQIKNLVCKLDQYWGYDDEIYLGYTFFFINNQKFKNFALKISNLLKNLETICRGEQETKI